MNRIPVGFALVALLAGCPPKVDDKPPAVAFPATSTEKIPQAQSEVWKRIVTGLSKQFFVINSFDKDAGLINASYSGDPEKYVQCGMIHSAIGVSTAQDYTFPASRALQDYQVTNGFITAQVHRRMSLDGRMNILVQPVDSNSTSVSVNTRYILKRDVAIDANPPLHNTDSVTFNAGESATYSGTPPNVTCSATGALEREILEIAKPAS
jgi:hypothetical protein